MKKIFGLLTFIILISTAISAQNTFTLHSNLEYANVNGNSLQLDLYVPNDQTSSTPLIIWIHGGGWRGGSRTLFNNSIQVNQARRGYAVATISYRLSGVAKFPAQIHDVKTAIRWLKANSSTYNINPEKVALWGSSAGGHLASLAGTSGAVSMLEDFSSGNSHQNSKVQAVLDLYGPTDLMQMDSNARPCSTICHSCPQSPEALLLGCSLPNCRAKARRTDPIRYADPNFDKPAFLIAHGTEDCSVPPHQSQLLHDNLLSKGFDSTLIYLEGAGHGGPEFNTPEMRAITQEFFDTHLLNDGDKFSRILQNDIKFQFVSQSLFKQVSYKTN